jgi:hypothetical protein
MLREETELVQSGGGAFPVRRGEGRRRPSQVEHDRVGDGHADPRPDIEGEEEGRKTPQEADAVHGHGG